MRPSSSASIACIASPAWSGFNRFYQYLRCKTMNAAKLNTSQSLNRSLISLSRQILIIQCPPKHPLPPRAAEIHPPSRAQDTQQSPSSLGTTRNATDKPPPPPPAIPVPADPADADRCYP